MLKEGFDSCLGRPRGGLGVLEPDSSLWGTAKGQEAAGVARSKGNSDQVPGKSAQALPPPGTLAAATGPRGGRGLSALGDVQGLPEQVPERPYLALGLPLPTPSAGGWTR